MKYIWNEILDPWRLVTYFIVGFALSFGPWVTSTHFISTVTTVIGAYLILIIWIILRTICLTIYRKIPMDPND